MSFDITHLLENWDYQPGQVVVRRFKGKDGAEKIQLRLDLGILQMNVKGRPDGKRPYGYPSLYEYFQGRLGQHQAEHDGSDEGFALKAEDLTRLQMEAIQYHHRYICLIQIDDYDAAIRDTERNLDVFDFAQKYAAAEEMAWSLQQFRPQLILMHTRARAGRALDQDDYETALATVDAGMETMREFFQQQNRLELMEQSNELRALETWRRELEGRRPLSKREKLERELQDAVMAEDYEKAAEVRDALRNLNVNQGG